MRLTPELLHAVLPQWPETLDHFAGLLGECMGEAGIDTVLRAAHFVGQVRVESGGGRYWRELADSSAYEGRIDLGNVEVGDGQRFPGRGLLQVTGRRRTLEVLAALGLPADRPELLEQPEHGVRSACLIWSRLSTSPGWLSERAIRHGVPYGASLSALADLDDIEHITWAINGGQTNLLERQKGMNHALTHLIRQAKLL